MTWTYICDHCGKLFYIHGVAGEHMGKLVDARYVLGRQGYDVKDVPLPWKLVQSRARCCDNPNVSPIFR